MRLRIFLFLLGFGLFAGLAAGPLAAQLGLPQISVPQPGTVLDPVTGQVLDQVQEVEELAMRQAQRLEDLRLDRIRRLVRRNREIIDVDVNGAPARRGELLVMDVSEAELARAAGAGYEVLGQEAITGIDVTISRVAVP